jgi:hypothetical protein
MVVRVHSLAFLLNPVYGEYKDEIPERPALVGPLPTVVARRPKCM